MRFPLLAANVAHSLIAAYARSMWATILTVAAITAGWATEAAAQFGPPWENLTVAASTDQSSYFVGEPIEVKITAYNSGTTPITLSFPSTLQAVYEMDGVYSSPDIGFAIFSSATIPALGSYEWSFRHHWDEYDVGLGFHKVSGRVGTNFLATPAEFEIVQAPLVKGDVHIDFETHPNGDPTSGIWLKAFDAWGVRFRSDGGDLSFQQLNGNHALWTPSGSHPFNVVADFSLPVYGVSLNVGTAANETVRMLAYDANQNLLGSVKSAPTLTYSDVSNELHFHSDVPIASVKWLSSNPLATVIIDNLHLDVTPVPEPTAAWLLLTAAAVLGWNARRAGFRPAGNTHRRSSPTAHRAKNPTYRT